MVCKKCGYQNAQESTYCVKCGGPLSAKTEKRQPGKRHVVIIALCAIIVGVCIGGLVLSNGNSYVMPTNKSDQMATEQTVLQDNMTEPGKDLVADAYFKALSTKALNGTGEAIVLTYRIPEISIPGHDMTQINADIRSLLMPDVEQAERDIEKSGSVSLVRGIDYRESIFQDILSLVIVRDYEIGEYGYEVYNISISTGTCLTNEAVTAAAGLSEDEFYDKARDAMEAYFRNGWDLEIEEIEESFNEQLENTVADDNVKRVKPYINEKGQLCIIAEIYSMADADSYFRDLNLADFESTPSYIEEEKSIGSDMQEIQNSYWSVYLNELEPEEKKGKIWHHYNGKLDFITSNDHTNTNVPGQGNIRPGETQPEPVFDDEGNVYTYGLHMDGPELGPYYVTYNLGGRFSEFSAWCMIPRYVSKTEDARNYYKNIKIYLDDELEYITNDMKSGSLREEIILDVTGVKKLKIEYPATKGSNELAVLGDAKLRYVTEEIMSNSGIIAAGGRHTVIMLSDGTAISAGLVGGEDTGYDGYEFDLSEWEDLKAVGAGDYYAIGLKNDGTVVHVGSNKYGEGNVYAWRNVEAIAAGDKHVVVLRSDGTLDADGWNDHGQCDVDELMKRAGDRKIIGIAAGHRHTAALYSDGRVYAIGNNEQGQRNVTNWTDVVAIYAGANYTAGLCADGTVKITSGEERVKTDDVKNWKNVELLASGDYLVIVETEDGQIRKAGDGNYETQYVSDWSNVIAMGSGSRHSVAILSNGQIKATGEEKYGQCGVRDYLYR